LMSYQPGKGARGREDNDCPKFLWKGVVVASLLCRRGGEKGHSIRPASEGKKSWALSATKKGPGKKGGGGKYICNILSARGGRTTRDDRR